jgi:hypothetical protein
MKEPPPSSDELYECMSNTIDVCISMVTRRTWTATFFAFNNPESVQCKVPIEIIDPPALVLVQFFTMMEEESDDGMGLHHNSHCILDNWKQGRVSVLAIKETDETYVLGRHPWFMPVHGRYNGCGSGYLFFPALISTDKPHSCDFLWVGENLRRRGAGQALVQMAHIERCDVVLRAARTFWDKLRIPYSHVA